MKPTQTPLTDKTVVVTGKLAAFTRAEAESMVARMGGTASGSVTKKTNFVVVGESPGSKLKKANQLGIPVLTDAEFCRMLEEHGL